MEVLRSSARLKAIAIAMASATGVRVDGSVNSARTSGHLPQVDCDACANDLSDAAPWGGPSHNLALPSDFVHGDGLAGSANGGDGDDIGANLLWHGYYGRGYYGHGYAMDRSEFWNGTLLHIRAVARTTGNTLSFDQRLSSLS